MPEDNSREWCDHCDDWGDHDTSNCDSYNCDWSDPYCHDCGEWGHDCERPRQDGVPGTAVRTCNVCGTLTTHRHLLTEMWLCDCRAAAAVDRNEPVNLSRSIDCVTLEAA